MKSNSSHNINDGIRTLIPRQIPINGRVFNAVAHYQDRLSELVLKRIELDYKFINQLKHNIEKITDKAERDKQIDTLNADILYFYIFYGHIDDFIANHFPKNIKNKNVINYWSKLLSTTDKHGITLIETLLCLELIPDKVQPITKCGMTLESLHTLGFQLTAQNTSGKSLMHIAGSCGSVTTCMKLLKMCDVTQKDSNGDTFLHVLLASNEFIKSQELHRPETIECLVNQSLAGGLDITARNIQGLTCIDTLIASVNEIISDSDRHQKTRISANILEPIFRVLYHSHAAALLDIGMHSACWILDGLINADAVDSIVYCIQSGFPLYSREHHFCALDKLVKKANDAQCYSERSNWVKLIDICVNYGGLPNIDPIKHDLAVKLRRLQTDHMVKPSNNSVLKNLLKQKHWIAILNQIRDIKNSEDCDVDYEIIKALLDDTQQYDAHMQMILGEIIKILRNRDPDNNINLCHNGVTSSLIEQACVRDNVLLFAITIQTEDEYDVKHLHALCVDNNSYNVLAHIKNNFNKSSDYSLGNTSRQKFLVDSKPKLESRSNITATRQMQKTNNSGHQFFQVKGPETMHGSNNLLASFQM